ncbi:hypothetical protein NDU88_006383 [Pleurodeles waltl]|uniref:Uncharacterized protein n=1 Tax=Pleurodeles waltl TaxID=8319 RepID=A0AAV7RMW5_PLEWA|nr:hypothetical protein NDU88_006383 [Pleurodeles waltl]
MGEKDGAAGVCHRGEPPGPGWGMPACFWPPLLADPDQQPKASRFRARDGTISFGVLKSWQSRRACLAHFNLSGNKIKDLNTLKPLLELSDNGISRGLELPRSFFVLCAPPGRQHSHSTEYGTPNVPRGKEAGRASQLRAPRVTCLLEVRRYQPRLAWSSRSFLLLFWRRRGVSAGLLVATVGRQWTGPQKDLPIQKPCLTPGGSLRHPPAPATRAETADGHEKQQVLAGGRADVAEVSLLGREGGDEDEGARGFGREDVAVARSWTASAIKAEAPSPSRRLFSAASSRPLLGHKRTDGLGM